MKKVWVSQDSEIIIAFHSNKSVRWCFPAKWFLCVLFINEMKWAAVVAATRTERICFFFHCVYKWNEMSYYYYNGGDERESPFPRHYHISHLQFHTQVLNATNALSHSLSLFLSLFHARTHARAGHCFFPCNAYHNSWQCACVWVCESLYQTYRILTHHLFRYRFLLMHEDSSRFGPLALAEVIKGFSSSGLVTLEGNEMPTKRCSKHWK